MVVTGWLVFGCSPNQRASHPPPVVVARYPTMNLHTGERVFGALEAQGIHLSSVSFAWTQVWVETSRASEAREALSSLAKDNSLKLEIIK